MRVNTPPNAYGDGGGADTDGDGNTSDMCSG
jgi:hypothetical protein